MTGIRSPAFPVLAVLALAGAAPSPTTQAPAVDSQRDRLREMLRERLADSTVDRPLLHRQQIASLDHVHYRPYTRERQAALRVKLPDESERARFAEARDGVESPALSAARVSSRLPSAGTVGSLVSLRSESPGSTKRHWGLI